MAPTTSENGTVGSWVSQLQHVGVSASTQGWDCQLSGVRAVAQRTGTLTPPSAGPGWTAGSLCTTTAMWPPTWPPMQLANKTGPLREDAPSLAANVAGNFAADGKTGRS